MNKLESRLQLVPLSTTDRALVDGLVSLLSSALSWRDYPADRPIDIPEQVAQHLDPEPDAVEKARRLAEWRAASPEVRAELGRRRWTLKNWTHWFVSEPSWRIVGFSRVDEIVEVVIAHDDYPVLTGVLEWTASLYGFKLVQVED